MPPPRVRFAALAFHGGGSEMKWNTVNAAVCVMYLNAGATSIACRYSPSLRDAEAGATICWRALVHSLIAKGEAAHVTHDAVTPARHQNAGLAREFSGRVSEDKRARDRGYR